MEILVDGKIKEITVVDLDYNVEWTKDFIDITNRDEFKWNGEMNMYETDPDTFEWWSDMAKKQNKINAMEQLLSSEEIVEYRKGLLAGDFEATINQQLDWLENALRAKGMGPEPEVVDENEDDNAYDLEM